MFAERCMNATTQEEKASNLGSNATQRSSSVLENTFAFARGMETPCLSGGDSSTPVDSRESTAPSSETKASIEVQTLSDRQTPLLIFAGLVCGTIPMSMRDVCGQQTLDAVLRKQDGSVAVRLKEVL